MHGGDKRKSYFAVVFKLSFRGIDQGIGALASATWD